MRTYPNPALLEALPELYAAVVEEAALDKSQRAALKDLMHWMASMDPLELEEAYVELFDRGRATSLHLFEHVHGDSRDRGPAMIDLAQTYEPVGLLLAPGELPDFLPAVLEFVSTQPPREAKAYLGEMAHILNAIFGALQKRGSAYASVLGALLELAGETAQPVAIDVEEPLDETWAEPPVFDGCSAKGQARPDAPQPAACRPFRAAFRCSARNPAGE